MTNNHGVLKLIVVSSLLAACSNSSSPTGGSGSNATKDSGGTTADSGANSCPVVVSDTDCDKTKRPFVFVHGTYGSGDNFAHVASLLTSNGYCPDRIVAVEYDSLGDFPGNSCDVGDAGSSKDGGAPAKAAQGCGKIDAVVNKVLADNPDFTQVDFGGHSQGTAHCKTYLKDPNNAKKVAHYFNFSGIGEVPNNVPTLSISSQHDLGNHPNHATGTKGPGDATANNVVEVTFQNQDHFACAASTDTFKAIYNYLYSSDNDPAHKAWKYDTVQCGDDMVTIEGIAETFADNTPVAGKLEIREVGDTPRAAGPPDMTVQGEATGHFGPIQLKRGVPYEFKGFASDGTLIGYQYFTPFKRSNRLVRLLSPASANDGSSVGGLVAMASTDLIKPRTDHDVAITGRWAGGAFRMDLGATLYVDKTEVLTDVTAGKAALATMNLQGGPVGFFMFDYNDNGKTDLGLTASGPFLAFTDVFMDATTPAFIELKLTAGSEDPTTVDETLKVPNWPSKDALVLAMFQ